ncbi:MAG: HAD family phosphatase [Lentilactobacillus diolivorans]|uniref:HAD family hydrolase n=1 Tax=Lentilactobacillus diolivorans TaxID=179838 RepID=UPI0039E81B26
MKGVIFDFNSTLFKDSPQHEAAWQKFAQKYLKRSITPAEFEKYVHGRTNQEILNYLFGRKLNDDEMRRFATEKETDYQKLCLADSATFHLVAGAASFFDKLTDLSIPITIATSATIENIDFYFNHFHLNHWFDKQHIVYNTGNMPSKPAPDVFISALNLLHLQPDNAIVFEDSDSGIQAAEKAHIKTIVGVSSAENLDELQQCENLRMVIKDYTDSRLDDLLVN